MIGWPEVALALVNTVQVLALAWIAATQRSSRARGKRIEQAVGEINGELHGTTPAQR
jgi:hypothetical protein